MNLISITKFQYVIFLFLLFIFYNPYTEAQNKFSLGGYLGGGSVSGFSTAQGSYTASFFIEFNAGFMKDINTRINFFYAKDFNSLLGVKREFFPFMKGFSVKGILNQKMSEKIFLEEGIGLTAINDRTFRNVNEWNYGVVFSLLTGIDFRKSTNGFKTGVGIEYGLTFHNTFAKYFSLHLQTQYVF
jgi:hypothetical protein